MVRNIVVFAISPTKAYYEEYLTGPAAEPCGKPNCMWVGFIAISTWENQLARKERNQFSAVSLTQIRSERREIRMLGSQVISTIEQEVQDYSYLLKTSCHF